MKNEAPGMVKNKMGRLKNQPPHFVLVVRQAWRVARKRHPISCGGWLVIWRYDFD
jgi:hypothetical protein